MTLYSLPAKHRVTVIVALSKAVSWNDSLIDAYAGCTNKEDRARSRAWKNENKRFEKILQFLRQRECTR